MAKAVVDPGELRRFAQDLKKFSMDLQQQTGALNARMATLSQTWRDQEQAKFSEEFEQQLAGLDKKGNAKKTKKLKSENRGNFSNVSHCKL